MSTQSNIVPTVKDTPNTRIAVYMRVSTSDQSTDAQEHALTEWRMNHYPNARVSMFIDHGQSGTKDNRPEFQRMLALVAQKQFDLVVAYRLDRLSRNASTAIRTILDIDAAETAFICIDQPALNIDPSAPFRRTILSAFAEIAQIERETIVSRVKLGLDAARARGQRLGAPTKLTPSTKSSINKLRELGKSWREVAKETGLSVNTVRRAS